MQAAPTRRSVSDLVHDGIRANFVEDVEDLAIFPARAKEPCLTFGARPVNRCLRLVRFARG